MAHTETAEQRAAKAEWLDDTAVMGKVKITIYKSAAFGCITGGNYGPGKGKSEGDGINFKWSLPIANISGSNQELIMNTLNSCMSTIVGSAQTTVQGYPVIGSGTYDGNSVAIGAMANTGGDTPTQGQLQIRATGVDLSDVYDPNFADLSSLPTGIFIAQAVSGETKRILGIIIEP